eukprot:tig00020943_g16298.t1
MPRVVGGAGPQLLTAAAGRQLAKPATRAGRQQSNRVVCIFCSSTFPHRQEERDAIRALAAPKLKATASERGLFLHVVDLRWGITDDAVESGEVVRLCLREVQRSRYFVGIVKARYGWHVPPGAPADDKGASLFRWNLEVASSEFPFVHDWADRSVTEIEMRAGFFLRDPREANADSLFYFGASGGAGSGGGEGPYAAGRLEALKTEIRGSGAPVAEYRSPQELALAMRDAISAMLEKDYPRRGERTWLEAERAAHEAFAASRRRVFIGDPRDTEALGGYAASAGTELFVLWGEGGSGKSALLANWADEWARGHPDDLTVLHFVGGSQSSSLLPSLARRLGEEVQGRWPSVAPPDSQGTDAQVAARLAAWLAAGAEGWPGRALLAIDALDQMQGGAAATSLAWLPAACGPRLRLVVSCTPGPALEAARGPRRGGVAQREVAPLSPARRRDLLARVLSDQGRSLSEERLERVASAPACRNPLYVVTLLEELSEAAVHATLDATLDACLVSPTPIPAPPAYACTCQARRRRGRGEEGIRFEAAPIRRGGRGDARELFRLVLARLAARHGAAPVREAASAIAVSRHGMAEAELASLLGVAAPGGPSEVEWQLLWFDARPLLVDRDSLYGFFHRCTAEARWRRRHRLGPGRAGTLTPRPLSRRRRGWSWGSRGRPGGPGGDWRRTRRPWPPPTPASAASSPEGPRALSLAGAACTQELAELLCEADSLTHVEQSELAGYWIRSGLAGEAAARYTARLAPPLAFPAPSSLILRQEGPGADAGLLQRAGNLLARMGRPAEALPFVERARDLRAAELGTESDVTARHVVDVANVLRDMGQFERAASLYEAAVEVMHRTKGSASLQAAETINQLAGLRMSLGNASLARQFFGRAVAIKERALGEHPSTASSMLGLAHALLAMDEYAEALLYYRRSLAIKERALGAEHPETGNGLLGLASALQAAGENPGGEPLALAQRALRIYERAYGPEHPETAGALLTLGRIEQARGEYARAAELYERAAGVSEAVQGRHHVDLAEALLDLATVRGELAQVDSALELQRRAAGIFMESKGPESLEADIARARGARLQVPRLSPRAPPHPASLATGLQARSCFAHLRGDVPAAVQGLEEAVGALRKKCRGPHANLATVLYWLGRCHLEVGDVEQARAPLEEAARIRGELLGGLHPFTAQVPCPPAPRPPFPASSPPAFPLFSPPTLPRRRRRRRGRSGSCWRPRGAPTTPLLPSRPAPPHPSRSSSSGAQGALAAQEAALGPSHPEAAATRHALGLCLAALGRRGEAGAQLSAALEARRGRLGEWHPLTQVSLAALHSLR